MSMELGRREAGLVWGAVGGGRAFLCFSGSGGVWQSESAEIKSLHPRITKEYLT